MVTWTTSRAGLTKAFVLAPGDGDGDVGGGRIVGVWILRGKEESKSK